MLVPTMPLGPIFRDLLDSYRDLGASTLIYL